MDTDLRHARRTGDPVAELTAQTRMPALRSLPPCRHCGRDLSRVDVACSRHRCIGGYGPGGLPDMCPACNGTGRVEWSWRGDTGRLALLAYAGDEAARALGVEPTLYHSRKTGLHAVPCDRYTSRPLIAGSWEFFDKALTENRWLRGLDRWPGALLAAGILAGRAVLPIMRPLMPSGTEVLWRDFLAACDAIDAATEHHLCGCELSLGEWYRVGIHQTPNLPPWVVQPFAGAGNQRDECLHAINAAIEATDEPTIRAAICAGLNGWARTGVL